MAYLIGSRALELVGTLSRPATDYDMVVSPDELAAIANGLKGTDFILRQHATFAGKFALVTDTFVGDLTLVSYPSHHLVTSRLASFCDRTTDILGILVHVASLPTLWVYKRGPATYPVHKRKTLGDLIDLSNQLFGPGQPADYSILNQDQIELLDLLRAETRSRVDPEERQCREPDDVDVFFGLPVRERLAFVRQHAPDFDQLHRLLGDLTGTRTASFILDHIGEVAASGG